MVQVGVQLGPGSTRTQPAEPDYNQCLDGSPSHLRIPFEATSPPYCGATDYLYACGPNPALSRRHRRPRPYPYPHPHLHPCPVTPIIPILVLLPAVALSSACNLNPTFLAVVPIAVLVAIPVPIPVLVPSSRPCFLALDPVPVWPFLICLRPSPSRPHSCSIPSSTIDSRRPNPAVAPSSSRRPNLAAALSSATVGRDRVTATQRARRQPLLCLRSALQRTRSA
ncbi:hypothetical protein ACLOJK_015414 [Asimina triloba]